MRLNLLVDDSRRAATIEVDETGAGVCAITYDPEWIGKKGGHALSPALRPDELKDLSTQAHNLRLTRFLSNWLPEGQALDAAAQALKVSKTSLFGLLVGLGLELPSAFSLLPEGVTPEPTDAAPRALEYPELSARIQSRADMPFVVWDGRVRLSIAGYQDKIGVYERDGKWFLVDGLRHASTHLLKPEPEARRLAGLVSNEFFCMRLAKAVGISCASVDLHHVPEPVLAIKRFDRQLLPDGDVKRLAVIDGCQALDLSVAQKYERPFGDGRDVANVRTGASIRALFDLVNRQAARSAAQRIELLRWTILQVLIGNTDAHAKNLSFFTTRSGLSLTPAYDLVCGLAFLGKGLEDSLAMAIGDTFNPQEVRAYDWAQMAYESRLPPKQVGIELRRLSGALLAKIPRVREQALVEGADVIMVDKVVGVISRQCEQAKTDAHRVEEVDPELFGEKEPPTLRRPDH